MEYVIVAIFFLSSLFILIFSLGQLHLTLYYLRKLKRDVLSRVGKGAGEEKEVWPKVTVQLPVYNELYVVSRLIDTVAALDYPLSQFEIQVLDDSTDVTVEIIDERVKFYRDKGIDIKHIRRPNRVGFKAGALQYGLGQAKGDFIAIFDADFTPGKDFLKRTIPYFKDEENGVVQTSWGHINKNYSVLTRLQAFGLDAHFSIEQGGRNHAGSFINFNGTAGVWRKTCIDDAGGWSSDTLTEDLDLSYRAQLRGWKFKYLEDVVTLSELPVTMGAVKSQQFRWNKGGAETARKNLFKVLRSRMCITHKIHACLHLLNSSVYVFLFIAVLLSIPLLILKDGRPVINFFVQLSSLFVIGFLSISFFYYVASRKIQPSHTTKYFMGNFPLFLMACMGMLLHNSCAVVSGFVGVKSPFVRTPKFNIENSTNNVRANVYNKPKISLLTFFEGLLSVYFLFGVVAGLLLQDYWLILFHGMLCAGFAFVFYHSIKEV